MRLLVVPLLHEPLFQIGLLAIYATESCGLVSASR